MALTKDQLIQDIAEAIDAQKTTVRSALDQLAEIVKDALENDGEITLPGIGKLKVSERPARTVPQPADRQGDRDRCQACSQVRSGQGADRRDQRLITTAASRTDAQEKSAGAWPPALFFVFGEPLALPPSRFSAGYSYGVCSCSSNAWQSAACQSASSGQGFSGRLTSTVRLPAARPQSRSKR